MTVTVKDVARAAGVSLATAARALGDYGSVNAATRERVQEAARQLGYVPNTIARALASGISSAVGVVLGDVGNPFFGTIVRAMSDVLEARGYTLLLANSDESPERERVAVEALRARRVDGLIVVPSSSTPSAHLRQAASERAPLVLLDRTVRGLAVDSVTVENVAAADGAVGHLLDLGHRRIGTVMDDPGLGSPQQRLDGYRRAFAARGVAVDEELIVVAGRTRDEAYVATQHLLARADPPTALFATNNYMALGAMLAIRDRRLRIPRDISLLAFDDIEWTSFVDPPLTVVALPATELGRVCGERLLSRMDGDSSRPKRLTLKTELLERGSCGPPRDAL